MIDFCLNTHKASHTYAATQGSPNTTAADSASVLHTSLVWTDTTDEILGLFSPLSTSLAYPYVI